MFWGLAAQGNRPIAMPFTEAFAGTPLDKTGFTRTFFDDFTYATMTDGIRSQQYSRGNTGSLHTDVSWFSPVHADFQAPTGATFVDPETLARNNGGTSTVSPLALLNGTELRLRAEPINGIWQAGHVQSVDWRSAGFTQRWGIFECKAKFGPNMATRRGSWIGIWHLSQTFGAFQERIEIDTIEAYGFDAGMHCSLHLRNPYGNLDGNNTPGHGEAHTSDYVGLNSAFFDGNYHTFAMKVMPDWLYYYFDGLEVCRCQTQPIFARAMHYWLLTMTMNINEMNVPGQVAAGQYDMIVDWVDTYEPPGGSPKTF